MAEKKRASSLKGYGEGEEAELGRRSAREALRALVGMQPYDETNPTEVYRILSTPTPLAAVGMIGRKGLSGIFDAARSSNAFKGRGLDVAQAEQFSVKELMDRLKEQGIDVERTWLRGKKDPGQEFQKSPTYEYLEAVYETQKQPDAIEKALRGATRGRSWDRASSISRQPGDRDVTKANTKGGVWLTDNPTIAYSYSGDKGFVVPVLTRKPDVVLDAKGEQWSDYFGASKEFKEAQYDPKVKSIEVRNIIDLGGRKEHPPGLSDDEIRELLTSSNIFLKKPFVDQDVVSKLTGEPFPFQDGGEVNTEEFIKKNVPRGTSEVPQLDPEGRLIDEREDIRSESQRMLNRLQSQPSKLPPGIRRTIAATRAQGKESMFPAAAPARDLLSGMFGAQPMVQGSEAYRTGQALANSPPVEVLKAPVKIASAAGDAATALAALGGAGVIKPKGGNWLAGMFSPEETLRPLKRTAGARGLPADQVLAEMNATYTPEAMAGLGPESLAQVERAYAVLKPAAALNKWIDTKLTKYVKNEMATPEDPVRALAERGILHTPVYDHDIWDTPSLRQKRLQAGMPLEPQGQSREARFWEAATDRAIDFKTPSKIKRAATHGAWEHQRNDARTLLEENPWIENVPANTKIYAPSVREDLVDNAGFGHLIDELGNAMHPESNLPTSLRIQPKDLEKITVPQAVERVAKINDWRMNNKKALAIEETNKADLYKAYPEQKYRWIQLNKPGQFAAESDAMGHSVRGYEPPQMGGSPWYGLGGWEAIQSGRAKVYSLRDAKGQSHATIEVKSETIDEFIDKVPTATYNRWIREFKASPEQAASPEALPGASPEWVQFLKDKAYVPTDMPLTITQIKGEGNDKIKEKFLPFVNDFVTSGNWADVKDLHNTGLIAIDRGSDLAAAMKAENATIPKYVSQDELTELLRKYNAHGYKHGGPVDKTTAFIKAHA